MAKNPTEIMEIFASYDLTRCAWSAAQLVGCDPKTVQRYVDLRDAGFDPFRRTRRARLIDPYLEKVEELVDDSHGKIRADVVHDRLRAMGFGGTERTTRHEARAVHLPVQFDGKLGRGEQPGLPPAGLIPPTSRSLPLTHRAGDTQPLDRQLHRSYSARSCCWPSSMLSFAC